MNLLSPKSIHLPASQKYKVLKDIREKYPEEACGILLGRKHPEYYQVLEVHPVTNKLHSPICYRMEPQEQLRVFNYMDENMLELVAIYHSHPTGPASVSQTDIEEAYYPEAVYLVFSNTQMFWQSQAFLIQNGVVTEVQIVIE
jgi:[CysO sulfur-carrier protein]-S-L-cysteine hydrolase